MAQLNSLQLDVNARRPYFILCTALFYLFIVITILHQCFRFTVVRYYLTELAPDLEEEEKKQNLFTH